ncbi:MAG: hypothetical protein WBW48_15780 [Anaerolineae bacterium]
MSELYSVTGTLSDEQTVILDRPIPLPIGRVRLTVETLPAAKPDRTFLSKLQAIRQALRASGYRPCTREEIDAQTTRPLSLQNP